MEIDTLRKRLGQAGVKLSSKMNELPIESVLPGNLWEQADNSGCIHRSRTSLEVSNFCLEISPRPLKLLGDPPLLLGCRIAQRSGRPAT